MGSSDSSAWSFQEKLKTGLREDTTVGGAGGRRYLTFINKGQAIAK